ncbi:hypothetical protein Lal_00035453 [Lupinus albus]|nr:hypothetical protein Lal_00035453 [Lupinus albus]
MAEHRPKRMKTIANRPRRTFETGGPSSATPSRPTKKRDPFFAPELQALRLVQFHGRKLAYVRYADVPWLVEEGFQFPHEMEVQGTNTFIGLHGKLYLSLIREFSNNFVYKKWSIHNHAVGGLSSSGEPLGNCENEQWDNFEALATYRSCLRDTVSVTPGGLTKVGSLTVENRLLHYVIAYILVQRNTNHAQPTTNDLKMIFAIKQGILVNWPAEILKVISGIATSSSRLLAYEISISRIIDHMEIDTSDVEIKLTNTHDHQLGEYLIHKMGIYKIIGTWMYHEDYRTTVDLDLSDEETPTTQQEQPTTPPEAPEASQAPPFGLAHLDAVEQCLNQRVDVGLQALNDSVDSRLMNLYDRLAADIQRENDQTRGEINRIAFILQTMSTGSNPPPSNKPNTTDLKSLKTGRINIQHDQDSDSRKKLMVGDQNELRGALAYCPILARARNLRPGECVRVENLKSCKILAQASHSRPGEAAQL